MTTSIDLSRVPAPNAIDPSDFETLLAAFIARFKAAWDEAKASNPALPDYDVDALETDPVVIVGQAWSYARLLDRARVNDAVKAVLAPLSSGADLDNIAAGQNLARLVLIPASSDSPAVLESDAQLLRRYLLSFGQPAAGTRDRYLLEAWTAWPAMLDAKVNGHAVHGRRGDSDVVIIGPGGRLPTEDERLLVRNAVTSDDVQPEAVAVAVMPAQRLEYSVSFAIEVPKGPDAELVRLEAVARVRRAADERMVIGGELPSGLLAGAAYGPSIIKVTDLGGVITRPGNAPEVVTSVVIEPNPYIVPILTSITISVEVR